MVYMGILAAIMLSVSVALPLESTTVITNPDHTLAGVGCVVDTPLTRRQGLVIRDRMPPGMEGIPCRTTLRSPEGKRLKVKLDHAILNGRLDFLQISDDKQMMWYIDRSCAPCHEENISGNEITVEFLLTNHSSRFQFRYTTNDNICPFLAIMPPLRIKNKSDNTRKLGASVDLECLNDRDYILNGSSKLECISVANGGVDWSDSLPSCNRVSNCPKIVSNETSGMLSLTAFNPNENYHCSWTIDTTQMKYIEFKPSFEPARLARMEYATRSRGLTFFDGEGRIRVEHGNGLRYRTRDSTLKIYFYLSKTESGRLPSSKISFKVEYILAKKTCPTIDEEAFPFGAVEFSDSFNSGSSGTFNCAPGYELRGDREVLCQPDGNWSFKDMPECVSLSAEENDISRETLAKQQLGAEGNSGPIVQTTPAGSGNLFNTGNRQVVQNTVTERTLLRKHWVRIHSTTTQSPKMSYPEEATGVTVIDVGKANEKTGHKGSPAVKDVLSYRDWSIRKSAMPEGAREESGRDDEVEDSNGSMRVSGTQGTTLRPTKTPAKEETTVEAKVNNIPPKVVERKFSTSEPSTEGTTTPLSVTPDAPDDSWIQDDDSRPNVFINPNLRGKLRGNTLSSSSRTPTTSTPSTSNSPATPPFIETTTTVVDRLLHMDFRNQSDVSLLLVVLSGATTLLILTFVMVCLVNKRCREKIQIRENPIYTGAPVRRIHNVSFRPNSRHKQRMQERNYT